MKYLKILESIHVNETLVWNGLTCHATGIFLYLLKTLEKQNLFYVFRGYSKRPGHGMS